jgi:tetratricopeptide (TPR) repeat protein
MTALGRVLRARGAPPEVAATMFRKALTLDADNIPALDALSELFVAQGNFESARALLAEAVERESVTARRGLETGVLYYRLGLVYEHLDRSEDGHTYLTEALRIEPKNLLLRIAVGMNRYRGQHWREALRHLQEVAEDPNAKQFPAEATEALYAAGQCETFLRRGDRAAAYYLSALELSPSHLPSLRELTRIASERGNWSGAADLMQRQRAVVEPAERYALLRALGDLYLDKLANTDAGATVYEELLDCLPDDEAERIVMLPRLLPVLRKAGRHPAAARAAERLAGLLESAPEQRDQRLVAAEEWEAAGDSQAADAQRRAALQLDPACMAAVLGLARSLEAAGQLGEVVDLVGRFLASQPPPRPDDVEGKQRRAQLLADLGRVQRQLGDEAAAIGSLERSLELGEELAVRQTLAELYGDRPEHAAAALQNHRRLLLADPSRVDSLRALARASSAAAPYRAHCLYQVLHALEALDDQGRAFLDGYTPPALDVDAFYSGEISEEDRQAMLSLPEVHQLREVFALLWEAAPTLLARKLEDYGVTAADRVSPVGNTNLAKVYGACARALGLKQTALYFRDAADGEAIQVVGMAPPAVIVSAQVVRRSVPELRFLVGRALELTQPAYILAAGLERAEFARLLSLVLRAFHPRHMRGRRDRGSDAMEQAAGLRKSMPFKVARRLGEIFREQQSAQFDSGQWRLAVQLSANRAGLALCGELTTALHVLREEDPTLGVTPLPLLLKSTPAVRDLVTFAASNNFYACRVKLGVAGAG